MPLPKPPTPDDRLDQIGKRLFAEARAEHAGDRAEVRAEVDRWHAKHDRGDGSVWGDADSDGGCDGD